MKGFFNHLLISLKLTYRNKQAMIFGYMFPLAFLFIFGSIFHGGGNSFERALPQLLALSALGASCFGLPITLVTERERGILRRYRLAPLAEGWFVASTVIARFVVVVSSALMQIILAVWIYHMEIPGRPMELAAAFTATCFAFMGLGLVIATIANNTASVQALGQSVFMPTIVLGGVGIPLSFLPRWAQHVAVFLPGHYAVEAMRACGRDAAGLGSATFDLLALALIGGAACLVASKLFRWETDQKMEPGYGWWIGMALVPWIAVGVAADYLGR